MTKYDDNQCLQIMKIYIDTIEEHIPQKSAEKEILIIAKSYPIHNFTQYLKRIEKYLSGTGEYGFSFPSNWAQAFLKVTNNNPAVIKALKEQQNLYLEKDGKRNGKLQEILDNL